MNLVAVLRIVGPKAFAMIDVFDHDESCPFNCGRVSQVVFAGLRGVSF